MEENSQSNVVSEIADYISNSDCQMFGVRNDTNEAFDYAMSIARAEGVTEAVMCTAIMVYHNTLVKQLSEVIRNKYVRNS